MSVAKLLSMTYVTQAAVLSELLLVADALLADSVMCKPERLH